MVKEHDSSKIEPARGAAAADENLSFKVELWNAEKSHVERVLARAASSVLAQAIFTAAKTEYPGRRISVRRGDTVLMDGSG
jgi:hypothetical protein